MCLSFCGNLFRSGSVCGVYSLESCGEQEKDKVKEIKCNKITVRTLTCTVRKGLATVVKVSEILTIDPCMHVFGKCSSKDPQNTHSGYV